MPKTFDEITANAISGRATHIKRATAVASALELIAAKVSNSPTNPGQLEQEMENLSSYADKIEQALK